MAPIYTNNTDDTNDTDDTHDTDNPTTIWTGNVAVVVFFKK